ncbi:MAG: sugar nucleotide-binding protein [Actinomycetota bacterium]
MKWSRRKKLMYVTGGSGFLGRHLIGTEASRDWEFVAPPSATLDIRQPGAVLDDIREWRPNAVVHLAYRRDDRPTIVAGSANVARAAAAVGAHLVHVSTDAVFGGRDAPYVEADLPDAITDYGRWKAEAEVEVSRAHPGAVVVRTSLIYGTDRLAQIQRDVAEAAAGRASAGGARMSFFTDEIRCPVHALDLARVLSWLAERPDVTGPLNVAGPEAVDRLTLARRAATWMGHETSLLRGSTIAESGMLRPGRIVLDTTLAASLGFGCRSMAEALVS